MRYFILGIVAVAGCLVGAYFAGVFTAAGPPQVAQQTPQQAVQPTDDEKWVRITPGPDTTKIKEPLDVWGYVDYVEALNRLGAEGVTPDNNAMVLLARAVGPEDLAPEEREEFYRRLGIPPLPGQGEYFSRPQDPRDPSWQERPEIRPWKPAERRAMFEWLQENEKPLELATLASTKEQSYLPLVGFTPGYAEAGGSFSSYFLVDKVGAIAFALRMRALLLAGEGNLDAAIDDLLTVERLARLFGRHRMGSESLTLIEHNVSKIDRAGSPCWKRRSCRAIRL